MKEQSSFLANGKRHGRNIKMDDAKIEELAKWAANKLNGGNWYDEKFYQFGHKEAWMNMIKELIERLEDERR